MVAASASTCSRPAAPFEPGTRGRPAAPIASFARTLSPIVSIVSALGPTKTRPLASQARAKSGFSARKPQPGWTASQLVVAPAATSEETFR